MTKRNVEEMEQEARESGPHEDLGGSEVSGSEEDNDLGELQEMEVQSSESEDGDDLSGSAKEEESSGGEDADDGDGEEANEAQQQRLGAEGSTAFGRAFGKIMKKRVPQTDFTEISGPVLADRKQLLVRTLNEAEEEGKAKISGKAKKREVRERGHSLPQTYTDAKEKALIKLATKGVVRLFNAVSKAQKVQADADISSRTAVKATWKQSKEAFMTELKAGAKNTLNSMPADDLQHEEREQEPAWAALRSDFMLGTSNKLADWDVDSVPAAQT